MSDCMVCASNDFRYTLRRVGLDQVATLRGLITTLQDIERTAEVLHKKDPITAHAIMRRLGALDMVVDRLVEEAVALHEQMVEFSETLVESS